MCEVLARLLDEARGARVGPDEAVHARNRLDDLAHGLVVRREQRARVDAVLAHQRDEPGGDRATPRTGRRATPMCMCESKITAARTVVECLDEKRRSQARRVSSGAVWPPTRPVLAALLVALAAAGVAAATAAAATPRARTAAAEYVGTSLRGRPIAAYHTGDGHGARVLVFGAIHGDETAGIPIADALIGAPVTPNTDIWVVPDLNPDGVALHRRQNGDGIDLNRNFPYRWKPIGSGGPFDYPGPRPLSEPETPVRRAPDPDAAPRDHDLVPPGAARRRPLRWGPGDRAALRRSSSGSRCDGSSATREARRPGRTTASRAPRPSSSSCRRGCSASAPSSATRTPSSRSSSSTGADRPARARGAADRSASVHGFAVTVPKRPCVPLSGPAAKYSEVVGAVGVPLPKPRPQSPSIAIGLP